MLGGVIVNILLAIVIFIGIGWYWGDEYLPAKNVTYGVQASDIAKKMGVQDGDIIISIDHKELDNFDAIESKLILANPKTLEVKRGDSLISLPIPANLATSIAKFKRSAPFVMPRVPVIIDSVAKSAVILEGAFQKNDTLLTMNNVSIQYQYDFITVKEKFADSIVKITAKRGNDTVTIKALVNDKGQLGLMVKLPYALFKTVQDRKSTRLNSSH